MTGFRLGVLALLLAGAGAQASPWAEPGDRQLRADVELLKAAGVIRGPVNAWPLPWSQIDGGIEASEGRDLTPHVAAARERVRALSDRAARRFNVEAQLAGTNDPQLVRDFGGGAREEADVSVRVEQDLGRVYISASVGFRDNQRGSDVHFDNSYAAIQLGNWALYGGYVEKWWGPGNDGALLFSNNARPFPKVGITRLSPDPINLPVLRWLGPVTFDIFAGVLTENRDFDDAGIIGIRLAVEPAPGLELAVNRGLQLCGKGRPCSASTIGKALIGFGDQDNTGTPDEPGNQLAGFDISYTRLIGPIAVKAYFEAEAEDEDNALIEQFGRLGGITLTGALGKGGSSWRLGIEYTDTVAAKLFGRGEFPGSLYANFIYTDGFTYRRRALGYSLDADSRTTAVFGHVTDAANRRWYGSVRDIDLNVFEVPPTAGGGGVRNRVSATREKITLATAGLELPTRIGDFRIEGRYQTDSPNTPDRKDARTQFELAWRTRF